MYGNASSLLLLVEYGVPQGSVDSPNLFINYMAGSSCALKIVIFADTGASFSDNKLCNFAERTGTVLFDINTWPRVTRLTFNENKTELIVYFRKQRHYPIYHVSLSSNHTVERVDDNKFSG